jgi:hypothetical protein
LFVFFIEGGVVFAEGIYFILEEGGEPFLVPNG